MHACAVPVARAGGGRVHYWERVRCTIDVFIQLCGAIAGVELLLTDRVHIVLGPISRRAPLDIPVEP